MSIMMTPGRVMYNLGPLDRLPLGEGRTFQIGEAKIALFRTRSGEVFALQAGCPHKNGPLADGMTGDGKVVCPLHGYKFCLASGEPLGNTCAPLKTYNVSLGANGEILLSLDR
ncbi:Rieske (2Fe-2S) protein [Dictyobacter aurantiacus]|uniref:Nitrite reductase NAD(P)H small subunit n=1 Tax=Dictyobacter aurantiacus TaxID=1936993 RepID=A0A401Z8Z0_9CHLR|nr:Rieske 2Fe-2S domain-containing protein [Dictyobacter aurantiacus]GCE03331.1 nitrite reductase NAD(P)H small subunit [Dictyobacter aurantiacus]